MNGCRLVPEAETWSMTGAAKDGGVAPGQPGWPMSARGLNSPGGNDSAANASVTEESPVCPQAGQAGGASAFWLTVAAGTVPSHHAPTREGDTELITRELEMANPDLLRLFKQQ